MQLMPSEAMARAVVLVVFLASSVLPAPVDGMPVPNSLVVPPPGLRVPVASHLGQSPLSMQDGARLRKVEEEVKRLKVPPRFRQTPSSDAPVPKCKFMGGLISGVLSGQCCNNVQVISQNRLEQYGVAQQCKPGWECEADGQTPKPSFEAKSLSEMCGEYGCLPAVVGAMRSNWMTSAGAEEMNGICASLAALGGRNANAQTVSGLLHAKPKGSSHDDTGDSRAQELDCKENVCNIKEVRKEMCDPKEGNKTDVCYETCCADDSLGCFPGEATADVRDRGSVALKKLRTGDLVLVERQGRLNYEPVLSFLHVIHEVAGVQQPFITVVHSQGEFRATENHIVFIVADANGGSQVSKLVGRLEVGDELIIVDPSNQKSVTSSPVSSVRRSAGMQGLYAPLTASGTIVVDGVVASNYASPSMHKDLGHDTAHAFLLPVRIYHMLGLNVLLQPLFNQFATVSGEAEEMHPYLAFMFRCLKLDLYLASH